MPTYEYECRKCGHEFEKYQGMNDPPLKRCPKCKGSIRRKIGSGAGLLFKGSGFYTTDYRSEGYKKSAASEKQSAAPKVEKKESAKLEKQVSTSAKKSDV